MKKVLFQHARPMHQKQGGGGKEPQHSHDIAALITPQKGYFGTPNKENKKKLFLQSFLNFD